MIANSRIFDFMAIMDPSMWHYLFNVIVSAYGALLFGWWWRKCGSASLIFASVTFMFIGDVIEKGLQFYARWLLASGGLFDFTEFVNYSSLWAWRTEVGTAANMFVVGYMTIRIVKRAKNE